MVLNKQLTFLDLFSGIGGFKIALERAGFKSIGFCDNDEYANKLYRAYFKNDKELFYDDIRKINTSELPDFDILCAEFPCQSFSEKDEDLKTQEVQCFLKSHGFLKTNDPNILFSKTLKAYLITTEAKLSKQYLKFSPTLGIAYNGNYLILSSSEYLKTGKECTLLDVIFPLSGSNSENYSEVRIKQIPTTMGNSQGNRVYLPDGLSTCLTSSGGGQGGKTGLYFINKPRFDKYKQSDIVETLKVAGDTPLMKVRNGTKKGFDEACIGDGINLAYPQSKTRRGRVR